MYLTDKEASTLTQKYSLLYRQYDLKKGNKGAKPLLKDIEVAKTAIQEGEKPKEVRRIIYFGSPHCQPLGNSEEKTTYVNEVILEILNELYS